MKLLQNGTKKKEILILFKYFPGNVHAPLKYLNIDECHSDNYFKRLYLQEFYFV